WFRHAGYPVAGDDKAPSRLTQEPDRGGRLGADSDTAADIPFDFTTNPAEILVLWTHAIPKESELLKILQTHSQMKKRPGVQRMITRDFHTIAVAGTHGKTSTSSLVAHLLKTSGKPVAAFLGGITQNYNSNLILPGKSKEPTLVVVEADEFDRSFLRLFP